MHTPGHGKLTSLHCACSDDISHPLHLKSPPVLFALPMDPVCEITPCCKWSCLSLYYIPISLRSSVEHQERGPTHLGVLYNPLDDLSAHHRLWSAFKVLCFVDHVAGERVPLTISVSSWRAQPFQFLDVCDTVWWCSLSIWHTILKLHRTQLQDATT